MKKYTLATLIISDKDTSISNDRIRQKRRTAYLSADFVVTDKGEVLKDRYNIMKEEGDDE